VVGERVVAGGSEVVELSRSAKRGKVTSVTVFSAVEMVERLEALG
jgi:hypothetical protein